VALNTINQSINHNGQKKKQRTKKHRHKTKDQVTQTPLKTGVNSGAPEG
jgi:hypothetical protein